MNWLSKLTNELLVSSGDGRVSISKLIMLVGLITCTYGMIVMFNKGSISVDVFTVYITATLGTNSLNKYLSLRHKVNENELVNNGNYNTDSTVFKRRKDNNIDE